MLNLSHGKAGLLVAMLTIMLTIASHGADPAKGRLTGKIVDSVEHVRINRNTFILVHEHGSETDGVRVRVDEQGSFSIELLPGFYDLFISSRGFAPACGQVAIEAGKTIVYNAELRMSEVVNTPDSGVYTCNPLVTNKHCDCTAANVCICPLTRPWPACVPAAPVPLPVCWLLPSARACGRLRRV